MNAYGAHRWYKMTNEAYLKRTKIAIAINNIVYSAPMVASPIESGYSQISGKFSWQEAFDLANVLNSGKIIPKLKYVTHHELLSNKKE